MDLDTTFTIQRRTLLVAVGASGVLVACGSGDDGSGDPPTSSPDPTPSASAPSEAATSGGEVVAAAADVPVGGGAINTDAHVVVTQPEQGQYAGFSSICTHQGCDVSVVRDNVIACGCHGSQFSAQTGEVLQGPATQALGEVAVAVQGDNIVRA